MVIFCLSCVQELHSKMAVRSINNEHGGVKRLAVRSTVIHGGI